MTTIEANAGEHISIFVRRIIAAANDRGCVISGVFNGIPVIVNGDTDPDAAAMDWSDECVRRSKKWRQSPAGIKAKQDADDRAAQREKANAEVSSYIASVAMKVSDDQAWDDFVRRNTDPYGAGVVRYAERWARLMQARMADGSKLEDIAKQASHDADNEGVTGFMYGCAVSMLSQTWEHGEELRRWHNLDSQLGAEGEKANATGGVLNPALLCVS
jgi:hypothetical protein